MKDEIKGVANLILIKITKETDGKTGELKHALKRSKTVEQFEKKGARRSQSRKGPQKKYSSAATTIVSIDATIPRAFIFVRN